MDKDKETNKSEGICEECQCPLCSNCGKCCRCGGCDCAVCHPSKVKGDDDLEESSEESVSYS